MVTTRRRRRRGGFTLIEVMIAFVLSTVALLGALGLTLSLLTGSSFARNVTEASTLAHSKLEAINSQVITLANPPNGLTTTEATLDAYGNVAPTGIYTRTTRWATTADGQRRSITVTVAWTDARGGAHSVAASEERIP